MKSKKVIYILLGLKGVGKTYLCRLLDERFSIGFVRVEEIWLKLLKEKTYQGLAFDEEGQRRVLEAIVSKSEENVVIESTGTAPWFDVFLGKLRLVGSVKLIRIVAPPTICLERVRSRNQSEHIPVSDERVKEINSVAENVILPWDMEYENMAEGGETFLMEFSQKFLS